MNFEMNTAVLVCPQNQNLKCICYELWDEYSRARVPAELKFRMCLLQYSPKLGVGLLNLDWITLSSILEMPSIL